MAASVGRRSFVTAKWLYPRVVAVDNSSSSSSLQACFDRSVRLVRAHDPSGQIPGLLLPSDPLRVAYYASRSFWIETGLRHQRNNLNGNDHDGASGLSSAMDDTERLDWWQRGIDETVFGTSTESVDADHSRHPTLRLLRHVVVHELPRTKGGPSSSESAADRVRSHLDTILSARRDDLSVKQYETMDDLIRHGERSCAPLLQLLLEVGGIPAPRYPASHEAARLVGTAHGLTNALRNSIPVVSSTGKLVIPAELCVRHGVRSPRYLLSALGQGDADCVAALQLAVRDIAEEARSRLRMARELRPRLLLPSSNGPEAEAMSAPELEVAAARVLLPGVASETFLNRLEAKSFLLTDRGLRQVGYMEHLRCAVGLARAAYRGTY
jgi:phytoene/squalene synthetase